MSVIVRIPSPLRGFVQGRSEVEVVATTVGEALEALVSQHDGLGERILDAQGELRPFVNVFVGDRNVKSLQGLASSVDDDTVVAIIPAVAGGAAGFKEARLAALRDEIPEVTPADGLRLAEDGAILIDVREPDEVASGSPKDARRIVRGFLELRVEDVAPDPERTIVLLCAGGVRSLLAADDLRRLGYRDVRSVAGGFARWKQDGLPVEIPRILNESQRERYARHVLIPEVGDAGQLKLLASRVLLVGAGGLGSPAALYLAAAGVGTLGIADDDVVDRSNLQRQILHTDARVGTSKVESARETLRGLNPDVEIVEYALRVDAGNVDAIFRGYDVIVDGSDNFATRYLVNDACVKLGIPNVHGSIFRFEGQVSVFWPGRPERPGPCYRCLFPQPPPAALAPSCAEAGVLGVLPGVIGTLEAVETIKLLLGVGEPLVGTLLHYDALESRFSKLQIGRDPQCTYCGDQVEVFPGYVEYDQLCRAAG